MAKSSTPSPSASSKAGTTPLLSRRAVLAMCGVGLAIAPELSNADPNPPENRVMAIGGRTQSPAQIQGAAKWLAQSSFTLSSLETGPIGYLDPWGGDEYGYAHTYALSEQPTGVVVDSDTGVLTIRTALLAGTYRFSAVVTNREVTTKVATFPVTLNVRQAVTANRTGTQILHKTYNPDSGMHGKPKGTNYNAVFQNISAAILADQVANGNENLRTTILLRRGSRYDYTQNRWPCGIQYLTVMDDPAFPSGSRPQLRNIQTSYNYDNEVAILINSGGSFLDYIVSDPNAKRFETKIDTTKVGDMTVRMKTPRDASNLRVGRWHLVMSYDQQNSGGPPNSRYYDYVRVTGVSGAIVTLDRPLRFRHSDSYYERFPVDGNAFGVVRIMPMDVGGPGGVSPRTNVRLAQRQLWKNIEFVTNPAFAGYNALGTFVYVSGIDCFFENCMAPNYTPSVVRNFMVTGGSVANRIEVDKLICRAVVDNTTVGGEGIGSSTGCEIVLLRNSSVALVTSASRQFRSIDTVFDYTLGPPSVNDIPIAPAFPGPMMKFEFYNTTFHADRLHTDGHVIYNVAVATCVLGIDGSWGGNRLVIPTTSHQFLEWLGFGFEGAIVFGGNNVETFATWGYVTRISGSPDGRALCLDVNWVQGPKPTSGQISMSRGHVLFVDNTCVLGTGANWLDGGGFTKVTVPASWGRSWDFPAGYPAAAAIHS